MLNVEGYYNSLLALFDNGVEEGFIKPGARDIVLAAPSARELLSKMEVMTLPNYMYFFVMFKTTRGLNQSLRSVLFFHQYDYHLYSKENLSYTESFV